MAGEIYRLQSTEYGEVEEPFFAGKVGSSTMPHKRNPSSCEAAITNARAARVEVSMLFDAMVQEHERHSAVWKTEWVGLPNGLILLGGALSKLLRVLEGLSVDRGRMERNLELTQGAILSETVMLELGKQIGRQRAHDRSVRGEHEGLRAAASAPRVLGRDVGDCHPSFTGTA